MDGVESPVAASLRFRLSAVAAGAFACVSAINEAHAMQDNRLRQNGYLISRLDAIPSSPMARESAAAAAGFLQPSWRWSSNGIRRKGTMDEISGYFEWQALIWDRKQDEKSHFQRC
jgi:hypothetical protein